MPRQTVSPLVLVTVMVISAGAAAAPTGGPAPPPAGPPEVDAGCVSALRAHGARFTDWPVKATAMANRIVCEVPSGVAISRGATGVRYQPRARVNCAFGLRLARFEAVLQAEAQRIFKRRVAKIEQLGTYNCRRMAAYPDLVSEHSFANAIDVAAFVLADGRRIVIERDWAPASQVSVKPAALFLRALTRRLFDEGVFSVVLTPSYDRHHRNHLHLDGAPYSVDGT